jgi:hypothetical protein
MWLWRGAFLFYECVGTIEVEGGEEKEIRWGLRSGPDCLMGMVGMNE